MIHFARCCAAWFLCACLGLIPGSLGASEAINGAWATFYTSGGLHFGGDQSPWRYGLYGDTRYYDRLGGVSQYVLQPAVGYRLNSRVSFWGGYTYFTSELGGVTTISEHRSYEQVSWNMVHWRNATLKSRSRLEQRHRENRDDTDFRFRQQLRLDVRFDFNPNLIFILGDEYFYHVRDTEWTQQGYGQNRFYTGLGFDFHNVHIEALYMNQQYRIRHSQNLVNHLVVLNFRS